MALRDWLEAQRVTLVGMEAIGVYWKPVFHMLEDSMECWLNARHLRDVHVRKIDMADAGWIATGRARAGAAELRAAGADP